MAPMRKAAEDSVRPIDALEEGGHPPGDSAEREGDGGVAEDGGEVGLVLEE